MMFPTETGPAKTGALMTPKAAVRAKPAKAFFISDTSKFGSEPKDYEQLKARLVPAAETSSHLFDLALFYIAAA
jgi:hypothetical protein